MGLKLCVVGSNRVLVVLLVYGRVNTVVCYCLCLIGRIRGCRSILMLWFCQLPLLLLLWFSYFFDQGFIGLWMGESSSFIFVLCDWSDFD